MKDKMRVLYAKYYGLKCAHNPKRYSEELMTAIEEVVKEMEDLCPDKELRDQLYGELGAELRFNMGLL